MKTLLSLLALCVSMGATSAPEVSIYPFGMAPPLCSIVGVPCSETVQTMLVISVESSNKATRFAWSLESKDGRVTGIIDRTAFGDEPTIVIVPFHCSSQCVAHVIELP